MLRTRTLSAAALALPLVLGTVLASAGSAKPGHGPGHPGRFLERKLDQLELAPETRAQVQSVLDAAKPAREASREQIHEAHRALRALLEQDPVDEAAVMAQADAVGALMTESRKQELRTMIQVRALLSPDDRAELEQLMRERRGRHGERHGKRHGGAAEPQADVQVN
jgi:Spy/CpxP family protein refolding chaperone